ncbi:MAG: hypothetical protein ACREA0_24130, partial [bacterium]
MSVPEGLAQDLIWDILAEGLEITLWEPGARCQNEVPPVVILKVNPEHYRFSVHYFKDEGLAEPLTIQEWQHRTGASVLFNAGLIGEDYTYLGLLFKDGRSLGTKRHPFWHGLFVAEPAVPGMRKARLIDLTYEEVV